MSKIKRFNFGVILLLTSMILLSSNLLAQQRQGGQQREGQRGPQMPSETQINKMVEDLSAELSLTEAQETKILALYTDHFAEEKASMSSGQRPSREEMESLRSDFEDEVKSLLTDEQKSLFDEFNEKNKSKAGEQR